MLLTVTDLTACGTAIQDLPAPTEFGYESLEEANGRMAFRPLMMSQSAASPALLIDIVCKCSNGLCDDACSCTSECVCKAAMLWELQGKKINLSEHFHCILSCEDVAESGNENLKNRRCKISESVTCADPESCVRGGPTTFFFFFFFFFFSFFFLFYEEMGDPNTTQL